MEFRLVAKLDHTGRVESVSSNCSRQDVPEMSSPDFDNLSSPNNADSQTIEFTDKSFPYAEKKELTGKLHSKIDEMSVIMIQVAEQKKTIREMQKRLNLQERYIKELEHTRERQAQDIKLLQTENVRLSAQHIDNPTSSREPVEHSSPVSIETSTSFQRVFCNMNCTDSSAHVVFSNEITGSLKSCIDKDNKSLTQDTRVDHTNSGAHETNPDNSGNVKTFQETQTFTCDVDLSDDVFDTCDGASSASIHASVTSSINTDNFGYVVLPKHQSDSLTDCTSDADISVDETESATGVPIPTGMKVSEVTEAEEAAETQSVGPVEASPRAHEMPHYHEIPDTKVCLRPPAPLPRRPRNLPTMFNLDAFADHTIISGNKAFVDEVNSRVKQEKGREESPEKFKTIAHRHSSPDLRRGDMLNTLVQKLRTTQEWNQSKREMMRSATNVSKNQADERLTQFVQDVDAVCLRIHCNGRRLRRERDSIILSIKNELSSEYDDTCLNDEFLVKFFDLWPNMDRFYKSPT